MTRSALVILVPVAEPIVKTLRQCHDPMSIRGVPAHVTVLHPFRSVVDEETAAQRIELALSPSLPLEFRVDHLTLLVEDDDGQWTIDRSWLLRVRP